MYYIDLEYYRLDDKKIYKNILNIGWLDHGYSYSKGIVLEELRSKLLKITLFDLDQTFDTELNRVVHPDGIIVHDMHMRGIPFKCPFCKKQILIYDELGREMSLGRNEMNIPTLANPKHVYNFPTLLYHYIVEHNYQPPEEFLNALEGFDLNSSFNCNEI